MTISFDSIPSSLRIPFVTAEFNASRASKGPAILAYRALLVGQKLAAGSGVADTLYKVTSPEDVIVIAGRGSMLHRQAIAWFASNRSTELWIGVLADDGAGVAATGTTTVTGTATADGTISLYCGGVLVSVGVTSGDDATAVADAISAAIVANLDLPITSANTLGVVTHTFRHKGLVGNSYDIRDSYLDSQSLPAGIALAHVAVGSVVAGTTAPALTGLIAAMGDTWYNIISHPYADATSLTALEGELSSRFGPMRMIDGVAIGSAAGSHATLTSLGNTRNSQHSSLQAQPGANPLTPPMEFAAETAAIIAYYAAIDPARPFQTLAMKNAMPPAEADLFTNEERDLLLHDGIATSKVVGGVVQLERPITTYQTNAAGAEDAAYLDVTALLTLMYLRYSWRVRIASKYGRHKLANDGTRFGAGQAVMTPKLGKAEALGWFDEMELKGLLEGKAQFKADLVVERDGSDPNRMNWLLSPDLINSLIVSASQIAFRL